MNIPFRRDNGELSSNQMSSNSFMSSYRVVVEHSFGRLKNWEIINSFRSDYWKFNSFFRICCALHNNIRKDFRWLEFNLWKVTIPISMSWNKDEFHLLWKSLMNS